MKILHTCLAPGVPQMPGALEMLPETLPKGQVVIACYTWQGDQVVVAGYYTHAGFYEGNIAYPDGYRGDISAGNSAYSQKAKQLFGDGCWAGGDTGGFYRDAY